jgi:hypothetical protein
VELYLQSPYAFINYLGTTLGLLTFELSGILSASLLCVLRQSTFSIANVNLLPCLPTIAVQTHRLLYVLPCLRFILPHTVFMCWIWLLQRTAIISLYNILRLAFLMEANCVFIEGRTESVYVMRLISVFSCPYHFANAPCFNHLHTTLTRRKNGVSPEELKKATLSRKTEALHRKLLSLFRCSLQIKKERLMWILCPSVHPFVLPSVPPCVTYNQRLDSVWFSWDPIQTFCTKCCQASNVFVNTYRYSYSHTWLRGVNELCV